MFIMAGVLGRLIGPQKRAVGHCTFQMDPTALELETAKEILAEVFRVRLSEVDKMIQNRFEAASNEDIGSEENEPLWPQGFSLNQ